MSVVADFTVPADSFLLPEALAAAPGMAVEAERLASHSVEWVFPYHWASGGDFERFREGMADDPTVADVNAIEEAEGAVLYQVEWTDDVVDLITEITDQHGSILEATARAETWRLQLRFSAEEKVPAFREHFAENGRTFRVNRVFAPAAPRQREYDLTAEQRETLVTAFEAGYFDVPRELTIDQLADALDVSSNAVSQRLRRASANLVEHTLTIGGEFDAE
jgi:predicted DNA binding protein